MCRAAHADDAPPFPHPPATVPAHASDPGWHHQRDRRPAGAGVHRRDRACLRRHASNTRIDAPETQSLPSLLKQAGRGIEGLRVICSNMSMKFPKTLGMPVIRTDFSDDATWQSFRDSVDKDVRADYAQGASESASVECVDDVRFRDVGLAALLKAIPRSYAHPAVFVADRETFAAPDRPLLAVDLVGERGNSFRAALSGAPDIACGLFLGNAGFEDFAGDLGDDDVYRGDGQVSTKPQPGAQGVVKLGRRGVNFVFARVGGWGRALAKAGAVAGVNATADSCLVWGTCVEGDKRFVSAFVIEGEDAEGSCTCSRKSRCAHIHAVLLAYLDDPRNSALVSLPEVAAQPPSPGVHGFALRLLARDTSPAALQALLSGLDDRRTIDAAGQALANSRNPEVVSALLGRLTQTCEDAAKPLKRTAKRPPPDQVATVLLKALAQHQDPRIAAAALPLVPAGGSVAGHFGAVAAQAVLRSADERQLTVLADLLMGQDPELFFCASVAACQLGPEESFRRLSAVFSAPDMDAEIGQMRMQAVSTRLHHEPDPRWEGFALALIGGPTAPHVALHIFPLLGVTHERLAVAPLVARFAIEQNPWRVQELLRALEVIEKLRGRDGQPKPGLQAALAVAQSAPPGRYEDYVLPRLKQYFSA